MQLSKSSFLFSWALFGGIENHATRTDTCTLLRAMLLKAPLKFLALTLAGTLIGGALIGAPLLGLVLWFTTDIFNGELFFLIGVVAGLAIVLGIIGGIGGLISYLGESEYKPIEMIRETYKAWDNKHCHIVYLED